MKRNDIFDDFERSNVSVDDGMALRTDEAAERLWRHWIAKGRPANVVVGIYFDAQGNDQFYVEPYAVIGDLFAGL